MQEAEESSKWKIRGLISTTRSYGCELFMKHDLIASHAVGVRTFKFHTSSLKTLIFSVIIKII